MTDKEKMELLKGMFEGANMSNCQIIMNVQAGAKVVYQENTQVNDIELIENKED